MKTVLVTGGAGFIGSNFVHYLYNNYPDYKIIVLDALTYAGSVHNLPMDGRSSGRFEFCYGDVRNAGLVDNLVSQSDIVFHFAAESHVTRSIFDNLCFFETDVIGTQRVANAVLKHKDKVELFVHISTSEVYGTAEADLMGEEHALNPCSPYAAAKCGADRLVYSYYETYKIPSVIIRPFNNYGPKQHLEKLVPRFVTSCLLDEPHTIHGDGTASRDWLYVEDHCIALDKLMNAPREKVLGQTFNLGTGKSLDINEISNIVREVMGKTSIPAVKVGDRPGQVFRHTCDFAKFEKATGWKPETDFAKGIELTANWYRENKKFWEPQIWLRQIPIVSAEGKKELH